MKVQVLSSTLDNQTKIVYDCPISGVSSAVERYPSKLDVVGSIPILRSEPSGSYCPIAQLAEHGAVNSGVLGSSPSGAVGSDPAITSRALLPTKT